MGWWDLAHASRANWMSGTVHGSPEPPPKVRIERVYPSLSFPDAVELQHEPASARWWVLSQSGRLVSFADQSEVTTVQTALELSLIYPKMSQALGFALHPGFATNRFVFVVYTVNDGQEDGSRLSRFRMASMTSTLVDAHSEKILLTWRSGGHNGSALRFGPDGFLYISTGDAGSPEPPDPLKTGQNLDDLLSCILRIDPDKASEGRAYSVPSDNPFVKRPNARPEIWAYGFRNPWRMGFGPDGALWVGDVGWELWETVHRVTSGYNGGWSRMEGPQIVYGEIQPPTPVQAPVKSLPHSDFASVTGGCFYRGTNLPWMSDAFVFGDFETGKIWALKQVDGRMALDEELCDTALKIVAFAPNLAGEVYLLDYGKKGGIHRLSPNPTTDKRGTFPRQLSKTGLFADIRQQVTTTGVVAYSIAAERWSDQAQSRRWLAVPGAGVVRPLTAAESQDRRWIFPSDSVLVKTLSIERNVGGAKSLRPIETQLLHQDGEAWQAYSYRWNEAGTEADLVGQAGETVELKIADTAVSGGVRLQVWRFASRAECLRCHNPWSGPPLAFNFEQLAQTRAGNELERLTREGFLAAHPGRGTLPSLVDPFDRGAPLEIRARSWLHANCASCHRSGAGGAVAAYFNLDRPLSDSRLVAIQPARGTFGIDDGRIIAPGEPWRSIVNYRISTEGAGHMPPLGSRTVDEAGADLIRAWIETLGPQKRVPTEIRPEAMSTEDALAFLGKIPRPPVSVTQAAMKSSRGPVRDLFQRFLPLSERSARLGAGFLTATVLSRVGSPEQGRIVFGEATGPNCLGCHAVGGKGGAFGPTLEGLAGRMNRGEILEHLIDPSKRVAPEFSLHRVEMRDEVVYQGFVVSRDKGELRLRLDDGRILGLKLGEIAKETVSPVSAMPEGLLDALTATEAADLLDYLMTLR